MEKIDRRDFVKYVSTTAAGLSLLGTKALAAPPKDTKAPPEVGMRKIDSFCHFSFPRVMEFLEKSEGRPHPFTQLFGNNPTLVDVDQRIKQMDRNGMSQNVLVPLPWLEMTPKVYSDPKLAREAAKMFNDGLAEVVAKYPKRFYAVALLPTVNTDEMMAEYERTVKKMGFVGSLMAVGPTAKYPVHPDYEVLYKASEKDNAPIWTHPSRPPTIADFPDQKISEYNIFQAYSWLLDSSAAMTQIAFKGVFDRYPNVAIVIHHHGALVPLFVDRVTAGIAFFEKNTGKKEDIRVKDPLAALKKFYVDTATQGFDTLKLQNAIDFFGVERCLFGTDCPMSLSSGEEFLQDAIKSLEALKLSKGDLEKIYSQNFLRVTKRT